MKLKELMGVVVFIDTLVVERNNEEDIITSDIREFERYKECEVVKITPSVSLEKIDYAELEVVVKENKE